MEIVGKFEIVYSQFLVVLDAILKCLLNAIYSKIWQLVSMKHNTKNKRFHKNSLLSLKFRTGMKLLYDHKMRGNVQNVIIFILTAFL